MSAYRFLSRGWRPGQGGSQYRGSLSAFGFGITEGGCRFFVTLLIFVVALGSFWLAWATWANSAWWVVAGVLLLLYDVAGIIVLRKCGDEQWPVDQICDWWSRRKEALHDLY
jgi:hypothetical protein